MVLLLLLLRALPSGDLLQPAMPEGLQTARCLYVIDGDTAVFEIYGERRRVRLIGVDAPELAQGDSPAERCALEAAAFTRRALEGRLLWLEAEVETQDAYGRLLFHIWTQEGSLFGVELLSRGYGLSLRIAPNTRYAACFEAAQEAAKARRLGLCTQEEGMAPRP